VNGTGGTGTRSAAPGGLPLAGLILLAVACGVGLLVAAVARGTELPDLRAVRDLQGRFTIDVPVNWQVATSYRDPALSAKSPVRSGGLSDTIEVIVRDLPVAISAENCARQIAQVMNFTIHHWETLREGADTMGGLAAYSRTYNWRTKDGQDRRSVQTCAMMGRRAFVVIGTTMNTPGQVNDDLPEIMHIMGTFHPVTSSTPETNQAPPGSQR
jgi:hypothetical protein